MTFADVCNFFWDYFLSAAKPEKPNTLFCYTGKIRVLGSGILVTVWLVPFYGVINCQDCYMEMVLEREKRTQCYCTRNGFYSQSLHTEMYGVILDVSWPD